MKNASPPDSARTAEPVLQSDPYRNVNTTLRNRAARLLWGVVYVILFRSSPRPMHSWRALLLRLFGAQLGPVCKIYPRARIWAPWNLRCGRRVAIADDAVIYNPEQVTLESNAIVSEQAYLCGASHDYNSPAFPMIARPIHIGRYAWICARATVQMGVTVGEGAVLALGSVATRDLDPWSIYGGIPARLMGRRNPLRQMSG